MFNLLNLSLRPVAGDEGERVADLTLDGGAGDAPRTRDGPAKWVAYMHNVLL